MGSPHRSWPRRAALVLLSSYALVFVGISVDILVRIWDWRAKFESVADIAMLFYFEGLRALLTLVGIALAWWTWRRVRGRAGLIELPVVLLLGTIAYAKLAAYPAFPGAVQEKLAAWFLAAHVPRWLLLTVFGQPAWTAWLGLAAVATLLAYYPRTLTADDVLGAGAADRRGALRDVALAGTDVGQLSRQTAARMLAGGWLAAPRVWLTGGTIAALHTGAALAAGAHGWVVQLVAALVAVVAIAVCIALYRAAVMAADPDDRTVLAWLRRGTLAGAVLFAVAGATGLSLPGPLLSVVPLSLAPAAMLAGVVVAVARAPAAPGTLTGGGR